MSFLFSINRPGGHGKVSEIHLNLAGDRVESLDIKYTIERIFDRMVAVEWIDPHFILERAGRSRGHVKVPLQGIIQNSNYHPYPAAKRSRKKTDNKKSNANTVNKKAKPSTSKTLPVAKNATFLAAKDNANSDVVYANNDESLSKVSNFTNRTLKKAATTALSMAIGEAKQTTRKSRSDVVPPASHVERLLPGVFQQSPSQVQIPPIASRLACISDNVRITSYARHATVGELYACDAQNARQFISQVVEHHGPLGNRQHQEISLSPLPANPTSLCKSRVNFNTLSYELLVDDGDGQIEEGVVMHHVNAMARHRGHANHFNQTQVTKYIDMLCMENKIMRSDGQLYSI